VRKITQYGRAFFKALLNTPKHVANLGIKARKKILKTWIYYNLSALYPI